MDSQKTGSGKGSDDNLRRYQQIKRRHRLIRRLCMWGSAGLLLIVLVVLILKLVFVVKKIEVQGAFSYTQEEILASCGISLKDDILLVSEKNTNRCLCEAFPYIKRVSVKRELPSTLILEVTEEYATFCTELEGQFFLFNHSMRLTDRFDSKGAVPDNRSAIDVKIPLPKSCIVPQYIQFYGNNDYISDFISAVSDSKILERMTEIDLRDRYAITVKCKNSVEIAFGDYKNVKEKIQLCQQLLSEAGENLRGHIDLTVFPTVYYDLTSSDPPQE